MFINMSCNYSKLPSQKKRNLLCTSLLKINESKIMKVDFFFFLLGSLLSLQDILMNISCWLFSIYWFIVSMLSVIFSKDFWLLQGKDYNITNEGSICKRLLERNKKAEIKTEMVLQLLGKVSVKNSTQDSSQLLAPKRESPTICFF